MKLVQLHVFCFSSVDELENKHYIASESLINQSSSTIDNNPSDGLCEYRKLITQVVDTCMIKALRDYIQECFLTNYGKRVDIKYIQTADAFDLDMEMPFICVCTMNGKSVPILRALCLLDDEDLLNQKAPEFNGSSYQQKLIVQTLPVLDLTDSMVVSGDRKPPKAEKRVSDEAETQTAVFSLHSRPVLISPEADRHSPIPDREPQSSPTPSPTMPIRTAPKVQETTISSPDKKHVDVEPITETVKNDLNVAPMAETIAVNNSIEIDAHKQMEDIVPPVMTQPEPPKVNLEKGSTSSEESGSEESDSSDDEPSYKPAAIALPLNAAAESSSSGSEEEESVDEAEKSVVESKLEVETVVDSKAAKEEITPVMPIMAPISSKESVASSSSGEESSSESDKDEPPKAIHATVVLESKQEERKSSEDEDEETVQNVESSSEDEKASMPIVTKPKIQVTSLDDIKIVRKPLWQPQTPPSSQANILADDSESSSSDGDSSDSDSDSSSDDNNTKKHKRKRKAGTSGWNALIMDSAKKAPANIAKLKFNGDKQNMKPKQSGPAVIVQPKNANSHNVNKKQQQKPNNPKKKEWVKLKKPPQKKVKQNQPDKPIDIDSIKNADDMLKSLTDSVTQ